MKNVKIFEDFDNFEGTEDEYLTSPEYFVETYYNGNYSQLRNMLAQFKVRGRMEELIDYMEEFMDSSDANDLKNWMLKHEELDVKNS